jgi:carbamoyltransferase
MRILGLSAFYHDSAAALVEDGRIVAAAQEERFTRKKHDSGFPHNAIGYCLEAAGVGLDAVDHVAFYDKPFLKFERLLETYLAFAPSGFRSFRMAIPLWLREKLFQKKLLRDELRKFSRDYDCEERLLFTEHHQSHAASAFFPSNFDEAAVLTMDGVGEWSTTSVGIGRGNELTILKELHFPHSLGLLYSAFTYYCGFKVNSGEYKVMGLAPYGEPTFAQTILDNIIDLKQDGTFWLDQGYFDYCTGLRMTNDKFDRLFGASARKPEELLTQRHMDLAASIQAVTEEVVLRLTRSLAAESGARNLCLAGGVALNCVANGKVLRDGRFERIWIQPAAGDAGGALGASLAAYHIYKGGPRIDGESDGKGDRMSGAYLGPAFDDDDSARRLAAVGARFVRLDEDALIARAVDDLVAGKALGWFQGRMEFGPRALGNRSIIADPRSPAMQSALNLKVKYRESFRPFAPAVLRSDVTDWFELDVDSPYMLLVAEVLKRRQRAMTAQENALFGIDKVNVPRSEIPAVTHIDYSARIQTVHAETNPRFHALLSAFKDKTGCPVLINTSFNVRGEPIVATPEDAFRCLMGSELDALAVGNLYLAKADQDPALKRDYKGDFELD